MWEIHICFHCHNPCHQEHNHPTPHPPKMNGAGTLPHSHHQMYNNFKFQWHISSFNSSWNTGSRWFQYHTANDISYQSPQPCCPLITPYHHYHSDHQSVSVPNSSTSLSFSSNITTDSCQFLPKIKMFLPEHIKLSSTNLLTKT